MAVRIGVVGVGFGSVVHIPALQSEGLEVVAVCARRRDRAVEVAERFVIPVALDDFDELLALEGLDAVAIATPVALHAEMASKALDAGKHVLCEKPFTLDVESAEELARKAKASGLTAMIAHEFRFASARMAAKELVDEGYLGSLRLALVRLVLGAGRIGALGVRPPYAEGRDSAALGAGMLFGLGSHYIDALRHLFGEVSAVSGELTSFQPERERDGNVVLADADDTFLFTLHFVTGGLAQMVGTRASRVGAVSEMTFYGSEGTLTTPQFGPNPPAHGTLLGAQGSGELSPIEIPARFEPFADDRDDRLMPFRLLVRQFLAGIEQGFSPAPNFADALEVQRVLEAVRRSAATGMRIEINH